jgi:hypothetical protein
MEKVAPLELTSGETYYLEYGGISLYEKDTNVSYRAKGKFIAYNHNPEEISSTKSKFLSSRRNRYYHHNVERISAIFENIESVNNKPLFYALLPNKIGQLSFQVAPYKSSIDIYKPINGLRQEAARKMINSQHINMNVPKFTIGAMSNISNDLPSNLVSKSAIVEGNWESETPDSVYYHGSDQTSVGNDLAKKIGQYFGGKRRNKTRKSRKSRKSRKTKSRRRR